LQDIQIKNCPRIKKKNNTKKKKKKKAQDQSSNLIFKKIYIDIIKTHYLNIEFNNNNNFW